jgi:hypothetical protein
MKNLNQPDLQVGNATKKQTAKLIKKNQPVVCESCGRTVPRNARQQRYCSPRCRKKSAPNASKKPGCSRGSRRRTDPHKTANDVKIIRTQKLRSSIPFNLMGGGPQLPGAKGPGRDLISKILECEVRPRVGRGTKPIQPKP